MLAEAESVFLGGIALWPTSTRTLTGDHIRLASFYANYLQEQGRASDALPYYERLNAWLIEYPTLSAEVGPDFRVWYGAALEARGEADTALTQYRAALAQRPDWVVPLRNIGQLLMKERKYADAADMYRRAVAADPSFSIGYVNLGLCLVRLDRRDDALEVLRRFEERTQPTEENAYYQGYLAERLGQPDRAAERFRRALSINPDRSDARRALAALTSSARR
jgi:tetratricopeptide (TPR) repeat protein